MSMPGAIEMSRHYASYRSFERDQAAMAEQGWSLEGVHIAERPGGLLGMLGMRRREVDAHYLRDQFPTE